MAKKINKKIADAMAKLEKRFGEPVIQKMNEQNSGAETYSSGRETLDEALGGGYGMGKIIEIYAESGCGKTGLALEAISQRQKEGGTCAIVDAEHALNLEYCKDIGIDTDELYIVQPSDGEQGFEALKAMILTGQFSLIVVDSVAALTPKAIKDGEVGEAKMAVLARMMSKGLQQITEPCSNNKCTVIFINQIRQKIAMYGDTKTTTGGKSLPFFATQRIEIKRKGWLKESENTVGFKQNIKVVKNKIGTPYKTADFDIRYDTGVDVISGLVELFVNKGILEKKGAYYKYNGDTMAQGLKNLRELLLDNDEFLQELKNKLKQTNE